MNDKSKLKKDKELKKAVKGYMKPRSETAKYYIISNPHWNGGKNYRVKLKPSRTERLKHLGYKVTLDYTQVSPQDKESAMGDHRRLL